MTKYIYEFGKRWSVKVPRGAISWMVNRLHVSTPVADIEADIRRRAAGQPGWTEPMIRQSVAYAVECHKRNGALYTRVMAGGTDR